MKVRAGELAAIRDDACLWSDRNDRGQIIGSFRAPNTCLVLETTQRMGFEDDPGARTLTSQGVGWIFMENLSAIEREQG